MQIVKNKLFKNIYEIENFEKEFLEITNEKFYFTPPFPRYQKWLIGCLAILDEYNKKAIQFTKFEQLKNTAPNLFSIRYPKSKLNPRVLYGFLDNNKIILLAAFKEKSKKDYSKNLIIAQNRLNIIKKLEGDIL